MKRFYYISDDLDDLERIEHDLEAGGIARPQIYLLSNDDVGLDNHDVNRVASFLKTDVIHSGEIGAVLGLAVAVVILLVSHFSGIAEQVGWVPFTFLAMPVAILAAWFPRDNFCGVKFIRLRPSSLCSGATPVVRASFRP